MCVSFLGERTVLKVHKIKVLLVDACTLFRQGIRAMFCAESDIEVVGESGNAGDAVVLSQRLRPDIVIMEIGGMVGMSSFEATRQICKERPETKVVFLSMYDDQEYLAQAIEVGANGYILKDSSADQLLTAIREVQRGGSYLSSRLLSRMITVFREQAHTDGVCLPHFHELTHRESEVLKMLAEGKTVKEVAATFDLSVKTAEAHKYNMMRKLGIHNKAQLVAYAISHKIVRLPELPVVVEEVSHLVV